MIDQFFKDPYKYIKNINGIKTIINYLNDDNIELEKNLGDTTKLTSILSRLGSNKQNYTDIMKTFSSIQKKELPDLLVNLELNLVKNVLYCYYTNKLTKEELKSYFNNLFENLPKHKILEPIKYTMIHLSKIIDTTSDSHVEIKVKLIDSITLEEAKTIEYQNDFINNVALTLGIDKSRIKIKNIRSGSVYIDFDIIGDEELGNKFIDNASNIKSVDKIQSIKIISQDILSQDILSQDKLSQDILSQSSSTLYNIQNLAKLSKKVITTLTIPPQLVATGTKNVASSLSTTLTYVIPAVATNISDVSSSVVSGIAGVSSNMAAGIATGATTLADVSSGVAAGIATTLADVSSGVAAGIATGASDVAAGIATGAATLADVSSDVAAGIATGAATLANVSSDVAAGIATNIAMVATRASDSAMGAPEVSSGIATRASSTQPFILPSYIKLKKFDSTIVNTDMSDPSFYEQGNKYLLTNGANSSLNSEGGGTTGALNKLGTKINRNPNYYFTNPIDIITNNLVTTPGIQINDVYFVDKSTDPTIVGVFHIGGRPWPSGTTEMAKMADLQSIYGYYAAIINYAYQLAIIDHASHYNLYLATVPGNIYNGGIASNIGMLLAVQTIQNRPANITLLLDLDQPTYDFINTSLSAPGLNKNIQHKATGESINYNLNFLNTRALAAKTSTTSTSPQPVIPTSVAAAASTFSYNIPDTDINFDQIIMLLPDITPQLLQQFNSRHNIDGELGQMINSHLIPILGKNSVIKNRFKNKNLVELKNQITQYGERLLSKCDIDQNHNLSQLYVQGDGDCLFYSLSIILMDDPSYYNVIKAYLLFIIFLIISKKGDPSIILQQILPDFNGLYDLDKLIPLYRIRFYGLTSIYIPREHKERYKQNLIINDVVTNTLFDQYKADEPISDQPKADQARSDKPTKILSTYETYLSYGTNVESDYITTLFKLSIQTILNNNVSLNIDKTKHLLYNCKLNTTENFSSILQGNHYELLFENMDRTQPTFETRYGTAIKIIDGYYILDIQLDTYVPPIHKSIKPSTFSNIPFKILFKHNRPAKEERKHPVITYLERVQNKINELNKYIDVSIFYGKSIGNTKVTISDDIIGDRIMLLLYFIIDQLLTNSMQSYFFYFHVSSKEKVEYKYKISYADFVKLNDLKLQNIIGIITNINEMIKKYKTKIETRLDEIKIPKAKLNKTSIPFSKLDQEEKKLLLELNSKQQVDYIDSVIKDKIIAEGLLVDDGQPYLLYRYLMENFIKVYRDECSKVLSASELVFLSEEETIEELKKAEILPLVTAQSSTSMESSTTGTLSNLALLKPKALQNTNLETIEAARVEAARVKANQDAINAAREAEAARVEAARVKANQDAIDAEQAAVRVKADQDAIDAAREAVRVKAEQDAKANATRVEAARKASELKAKNIADHKAREQKAQEEKVERQKDHKAKQEQKRKEEEEKEAIKVARLEAEKVAKAEKVAEAERVKASQDAEAERVKASQDAEESRLKAEKAAEAEREASRLKAAEAEREASRLKAVEAEREASRLKAAAEKIKRIQTITDRPIYDSITKTLRNPLGAITVYSLKSWIDYYASKQILKEAKQIIDSFFTNDTGTKHLKELIDGLNTGSNAAGLSADDKNILQRYIVALYKDKINMKVMLEKVADENLVGGKVGWWTINNFIDAYKNDNISQFVKSFGMLLLMEIIANPTDFKNNYDTLDKAVEKIKYKNIKVSSSQGKDIKNEEKIKLLEANPLAKQILEAYIKKLIETHKNIMTRKYLKVKSNDKYQNKYLKYKQKYFELKKEIKNRHSD